jgi:hypothetical protein
MFAAPDALSAFYLVCFLIGLVFVVLSAFLGLAHDVTHIPGLHHGGHIGDVGGGHGHADVGAGHGHAGHFGHADIGVGHAAAHDGANEGGRAGSDSRVAAGASASPLNLMTAMAFLIWFGGAGYILHAIYGVFVPLGLLGAVAAGLLAGWLVFMFLIKVLLPGTASPDPATFEVVGQLGHISIGIGAGGLGEVVYTLGGARHSDGARSLDDQPIEHGTEVVIVRYEKGIAYVQPWERFVDGEAPAGDGTRSADRRGGPGGADAE